MAALDIMSILSEGEENAVALYIEENGVEFPVDETAELVSITTAVSEDAEEVE